MSKDTDEYIIRRHAEAVRSAERLRDAEVAKAKAEAELFYRLIAADLESLAYLTWDAKVSTAGISYDYHIRQLIKLREILQKKIISETEQT